MRATRALLMLVPAVCVGVAAGDATASQCIEAGDQGAIVGAEDGVCEAGTCSAGALGVPTPAPSQ